MVKYKKIILSLAKLDVHMNKKKYNYFVKNKYIQISIKFNYIKYKKISKRNLCIKLFDKN